jgi:hypothetical protein
MENWEYMVIPLGWERSYGEAGTKDEEQIKILNRYGGEGWELVSVTVVSRPRSDDKGARVYFKRRIQTPRPNDF